MPTAYRSDVERQRKYYLSKRNGSIFIFLACIAVAVCFAVIADLFFILAPSAFSTPTMILTYVMSLMAFVAMCCFLWFAFDTFGTVMDSQKNADNLALSLEKDELL